MLLSLLVFIVAWARQPGELVHEEPRIVADLAANPWAVFSPNNGQITILKAAFYFPDASRVIAAAIIGFVAFYLLTRGYTGMALALPLLPLGEPGPYTGPLNGQWFVALAMVAIALEPPKRWHYPALLLAGLTGIAPCLAVPVFRDRRGVVLGAVAVLQAVVLLTSDRSPTGVPPDPAWLVWMAGVLAAMLISPAPSRTRLAFTYISLVMLALGAYVNGFVAYRYLAVPWAVVALGVVSRLRRPAELDGRHGELVVRRAGVLRRHLEVHALLAGRRDRPA